MSTILEQIDSNCFGQDPVISCTLKQAKLGSLLRSPLPPYNQQGSYSDSVALFKLPIKTLPTDLPIHLLHT